MSETDPLRGADAPHEAAQLLALVYQELRALAAAKLRNEPAGQTLQPTALVHEVWLRLSSSDRSGRWNGRAHFFGAAAEAMRRILIEQARHKRSARAGRDWQRQPVALEQFAAPQSDVDLLALDEALERLNATAPRVAEVVKLRYFVGLKLREIAELLGVAESTVDADWAYAKSWLRLRLGAGPDRR
jgi:RNA polymerase sigma factor (TIGR02999 family)